MGKQSMPMFSTTYKAVSFRVDIDGKSFKAQISRDALWEHFGAGDHPEDWVNSYIHNAEQIDAIVVKKIKKGLHEPVIVVTEDF